MEQVLLTAFMMGSRSRSRSLNGFGIKGEKGPRVSFWSII